MKGPPPRIGRYGEIAGPPPTHSKPAPAGESVREYLARGGTVYYAAIGESGEKDRGPAKFHVSDKNKDEFVPGHHKSGRGGWR